MTKEEQLLKHRIMDLATVCYRKDIPTYSDFLTLSEQDLLLKLKNELPHVAIELKGGFSYGERKMAGFFPLHFEKSTYTFPITCIKITMAKKFSQPLTHRDYLGAILNLGLERGKIGDILIEDKEAFVFVHQGIGDFIMKQLIQVKRTYVTLEEVPEEETYSLAPKFKQINGSVASLRLDAVIALGFSKSRSQMVGLIQGGKVFVNGRMIQSNSYQLQEGDVVSVRGLGKFIYEHIQQMTKKGRYFIVINRFI